MKNNKKVAPCAWLGAIVVLTIIVVGLLFEGLLFAYLIGFIE